MRSADGDFQNTIGIATHDAKTPFSSTLFHSVYSALLCSTPHQLSSLFYSSLNDPLFGLHANLMTLFLFYSTSTLFYPCTPVPLVSALFGSTRLLLYSTFVHVYLYCRIYLTLPDSTSILFNLYCVSTLRGLLVSPFYSSRAEPCCSTPRCSAPRCRLTKGFFSPFCLHR